MQLVHDRSVHREPSFLAPAAHSRWHQHPGSPQGGGRGKKGANSKGRDEREALGRSRGGSGTKACVIADGLGRAVAFILAPGQAHELPHAVPLLEGLPGVPQWVVADGGLSSHAFGVKRMIPGGCAEIARRAAKTRWSDPYTR